MEPGSKGNSCEQGIVIGVDLSSIQPLEKAHFIQGDITQAETVERIKDLMSGRRADLVLSDMSPDISGCYSVDQARSAWLCECALHVADQILKLGVILYVKFLKEKIPKISSRRLNRILWL